MCAVNKVKMLILQEENALISHMLKGCAHSTEISE
jgi:hypothetical protein